MMFKGNTFQMKRYKQKIRSQEKIYFAKQPQENRNGHNDIKKWTLKQKKSYWK